MLFARFLNEADTLSRAGDYAGFRALVESTRREAHDAEDLSTECLAFISRAAHDRFEHLNDLAIGRSTLALFLLAQRDDEFATGMRSQAWSNIASAAFQLGRWSQARPATANALRHARRLKLTDTRLSLETHAVALGALAALRFQNGRHDPAIRALRKAEEMMIRIHGELHFQVAFLRVLHAGALVARGMYEQARELVDDAIAILREAGVLTHPVAVMAFTQRCVVRRVLDDFPGAAEDIRATLKLLKTSSLDSPAWRAGVHSAASKLLVEMGNYPEARKQAQQALKLEIMAGGDGTVEVASAWIDIGIVALVSKRYNEAWEALDWAVGEFERLRAYSHPLYPYACLHLAIMYAGEDPDTALLLVKRGLNARRRFAGPASPQYREDLSLAIEIFESADHGDHALTVEGLFGLVPMKPPPG
jgi:tetratricopeptide (TPR) repeat protein